MSIVSNNIKYLRRLNGLTQEQFARKIGIKRSLLGAYEEARANPNLTNLKNMAHAFGISVDNLLKNDLRKIRESPDLGFPFNAASASPPSPLMRESTSSGPQPLSTIVARFQPPKPTLRMVVKPIAFKPIHQQNFRQESIVNNPLPNTTLRFNNHFENTDSKPVPSRDAGVVPQQTIQLVKRNLEDEYINQYQNNVFLNQLPVFQLPNLAPGHYRAFESGKDFLYPGSLLIGTFVHNWYDIKDQKRYVFITKQQGLVSRITYNQVKAKGVLLLKSDHANIPDFEISIKDVLEVWEIKAFVCQSLPDKQPDTQKLKSILSELHEELNRQDLKGGLFS